MVVVLGATHAILQDYSFTNSVTFRIRDLIIWPIMSQLASVVEHMTSKQTVQVKRPANTIHKTLFAPLRPPTSRFSRTARWRQLTEVKGPYGQGRNHGLKVEGTKVSVPTPGPLRPALGHRPGWVLVREGVALSRCEGSGVSGGIIPGKFLKTQMLNPAFWWLLGLLVDSLAVKFIAFWKLRLISWGTNTLLVPLVSPTFRLGDQFGPDRSLRLLRLCPCGSDIRSEQF